MNKKILMISFVFLLALPMMFAANEFLGTFEQDDLVDLKQICGNTTSPCDSCNVTSVSSPNSIILIEDAIMQKRGAEFNYTLPITNTTNLGTHNVNGICFAGTEFKVWAYTFAITQTGNPTPDNMPVMLAAIFIAIFGIACFFLFLSIQMQEPGPKLFFLIAAIIFIFATIAMAVNVAQESNVAESISSTLGGVLMFLGAIVIVIVAYIMIRQIVTVLDMYKEKKGLSWGGVGEGYKYAGMQKPYSPY